MLVFTSCMGPKFKLICVRPNLATQAKEYWTRRRNKVIAFPQWKHIFLCLKSLATLLRSVCEGPIHYILLFLQETEAHMASLLCVFWCLSGLVWGSDHELLAYILLVLMHLCMWVWLLLWMEERWLSAYIHLFVAVYPLFYLLYP